MKVFRRHALNTDFFSAYLKGPAKGGVEGPGRVQEARVVCAGWFFFFFFATA